MKILALAFALVACASAPRYDDSPQIAVQIDNTRNNDLSDPHFYLLGNGRYSLGIIADLASKTVWVDSRWLTSDGCMQIVAHFVGEGDWVSDQFCWRSGEHVDVKLMTLLSASSAWSHR